MSFLCYCANTPLSKIAMSNARFEDGPVPIRLKFSALWTAVLFCFIYADFFGLFLPGHLMAMNAGVMKPLGAASPLILLSVAAMMAIPSALVAMALLVPQGICRWTNIVFGIIYALIMILTSIGAPPFYVLFAVVEIAMLITIIYLAVRWPRCHP
jgi:Family of unknown function (DUF6326)